MLKRGTIKCPNDKSDLEWRNFQGIRIALNIYPEKPKRPYCIYNAKCPECGEYFDVKK